MLATGDVQKVYLEGPPRERGRAEGEALRALIAQGMERWKDRIHQTTGTPAGEYLDRFLEATDFLKAIEQWAPDLLEEVHGIGEGAGVPFPEIYAYQLMDEEWFYRFEYGRGTYGQRPEHCSTIAVFGEGGPPLLAQNMDLPKTYDGTQVVLHVKDADAGVESLVFTPAGLIGTTGVNSQAIGICCNSIPQLGFQPHGLPVAFVVRSVLRQRSWDAAVELIKGVSHASAQNYAVGGPERVADFECSPRRVVQFMPEATRVYHTNHPLAHDEQPMKDEAVLGLAFGKGSRPARGQHVRSTDSERRFVFLERGLSDSSQPVTVEQVKALLSSLEVPISVNRDSAGEGMTLGSLVMELDLPPVLHCAPGPPAETAYQRWTF